MINRLLFLFLSIVIFDAMPLFTTSPAKLKFAIDHLPLPSASSISCGDQAIKKSLIKKHFKPSTFSLRPTVSVVTEPLSLQQVARDTLIWMERVESIAPSMVGFPAFDQTVLATNTVKETLRYVIDLIEEDKQTGTYRILDPAFINKHFSYIKWHGDEVSAKHYDKTRVSDGRILLTHYMALCCKGDYVKSTHRPYALYQTIRGNQALSYTKQDVLSGLLDTPENKKKVKPLVWLSRRDLESALLQGSVFVKMPDGVLRLFNVHLHNNISYERSIKKPSDQKRYWYFREIAQQHVAELWKKYMERKDVVLAGDVYTIGIGKLIMLRYQNLITRNWELRLGIIADTGGALCNNLYQLDAFAGVVSGHQELVKNTRHMLDTVDAYVIYKKESDV